MARRFAAASIVRQNLGEVESWGVLFSDDIGKVPSWTYHVTRCVARSHKEPISLTTTISFLSKWLRPSISEVYVISDGLHPAIRIKKPREPLDLDKIKARVLRIHSKWSERIVP